MSSILSVFENSLQQVIQSYSLKIMSKYEGIDPKDLNELWEEVCTDIPLDLVQKEKIGDPIPVTTTQTCIYKFTRGKKGLCSIKTTSTSKYCSRHKKYEGQVSKPKKIIPQPKVVEKQIPIISPKDIILRKNKKTSKLWHPKTKMVFKSSTEKIVIGKMEGEYVKSLTDEDIEVCKTWGFGFVQPEPEPVPVPVPVPVPQEEYKGVNIKEIQDGVNRALGIHEQEIEDVLADIQLHEEPGELDEVDEDGEILYEEEDD